jgi:hypothetical protein
MAKKANRSERVKVFTGAAVQGPAVLREHPHPHHVGLQRVRRLLLSPDVL